MKSISVCAIFILLSWANTVGSEQIIYLTGSDWCPYICTEPGNPNKLAKKPGYLVEILKYALKNHTIRYESPSWERAIIETRKGTYDAIIGIYESVAPDFVYPETSLGFSRMCFYTDNNNLWTYEGIKTLPEIRLGIIEGYFYDEGEVDSYIKNNMDNSSRVEGIAGTRGLIQNLEKMLLGRIAAIIDDFQVVKFTIKSNNLPDTFKLAGCLDGIHVQIGLTPANPGSKDHAKKISLAVKELREKGELKEILNSYGIKDWE